MSSFKAAVFLALFLLSACGFTPLHGQNEGGAQVSAYYNDIAIANIPDRDGQFLRNELIDRLYAEDGRPTGTRYLLNLRDFKKSVVNLGIRKDATYTRAEMRFTAIMELIDKDSGKIILSRSIRTVGGYNLLDNQYATLVSKESVTDHLLEEFADRVVTEINLHFRR